MIVNQGTLVQNDIRFSQVTSVMSLELATMVIVQVSFRRHAKVLCAQLNDDYYGRN